VAGRTGDAGEYLTSTQIASFNLEALWQGQDPISRKNQILLWYIEGKVDENGCVFPGQLKMFPLLLSYIAI
jgi:hypothetical protein